MQKIVCNVLFIMLVGLILPPQLLSAGSALQISTVPGVNIWLDNKFLGKTTTEQNGMLIKDVAPGEYQLKASMPGYDPVKTRIEVKNEENTEWRIKLADPVMQVEDNITRIDSTMTRSARTGTVILKSSPRNAEIFIDGKAIGPAEKKLVNVAAAEHTARFVFQKHELVRKFTLQPSQTTLIQADFAKGETVAVSTPSGDRRGAAVIRMQSLRKGKPALFPHWKHQEMFSCADCHHGMDDEGRQMPYIEGMEINHCTTCHNPTMANKRLDSFMQAAHTLCKGCHRKIVAESGTAGPIDKCLGCHIVTDE